MQYHVSNDILSVIQVSSDEIPKSKDSYFVSLLYLMEDNKIVSFSIYEGTKNRCILNLLSIRSISYNSTWKIVNKDIGFWENRKIIRQFEERFLDRLGVEYEKKGNSAPLFYNWFK